MGGGNESLRRTNAAFETAIARAEDGVGADERGGGLDEGLPGAIVVLEAVGTQHLTAGNVVVRGQTEPGAEMLGGREAL